MKQNNKKTNKIALILLGLFLAGCGNITVAEPQDADTPIVESDTSVPESQDTSTAEDTTNNTNSDLETNVQEDRDSEAAANIVQENQDAADTTVPASSNTIIYLENPSWEHFQAKEVSSAASPLTLTLLTETPNQITDAEQWFSRNDLSLESGHDGKYLCNVFFDYSSYPGTIQVTNTESGEIFTFDFENYQYKNPLSEDTPYMEQQLRYAQIKDDVLYFSISHLTYSSSLPQHAYVGAIDLKEKTLLWKSSPLVSNSRNFAIVGDVLLCGYGFTAEPDYIYQLDLASGQTIGQTPVKSMADYLILKDDTLYVRTYDTDYTFQVQ